MSQFLKKIKQINDRDYEEFSSKLSYENEKDEMKELKKVKLKLQINKLRNSNSESTGENVDSDDDDDG